MKSLFESLIWFLKIVLVYLIIGVVIAFEIREHGSTGFLGKSIAWPIKTSERIVDRVITKGILNFFDNDKLVKRGENEFNHLKEDLFVLHVNANKNPAAEIVNLRNSERTKLFDIPKSFVSALVNHYYMLSVDTTNSYIYLTIHGGNELLKFNYSGDLISTFVYDFQFVRRTAVFNERIFCNISKEKAFKSELGLIKNDGFVEINAYGEIVQEFYLAEHLDEFNRLVNINQLASKFYESDDPFHLNDVELVTGIPESINNTLKNEDILLSSRHLSAILQIRKNKIIRVITGSFNLQHDVDVIGPHEISISNNNSAGYSVNVSEIYSNVIHYNLLNNTEKVLHDKIGFATETEGQVQYLESGRTIIENTNRNQFLVVENDSLVFKGGIENMTQRYYNEWLTWCPAFDQNPFQKNN